jgi:hypothetical protein
MSYVFNSAAGLLADQHKLTLFYAKNLNLMLLTWNLVLSLCLQLQRQAAESEATRRGLERARQEVVRQVTAIAAEKDSLEKEASDSLFFIDFKPP